MLTENEYSLCAIATQLINYGHSVDQALHRMSPIMADFEPFDIDAIQVELNRRFAYLSALPRVATAKINN